MGFAAGKPFASFFYLLVLFSIFYPGGTVQAQTDTSPGTTVEDAIAEAKHYANNNDIDLAGKFIKRVEYHTNRQNENDRPYWQVYWINRQVTKGGDVEIRLYTDGSIEEYYHK